VWLFAAILKIYHGHSKETQENTMAATSLYGRLRAADSWLQQEWKLDSGDTYEQNHHKKHASHHKDEQPLEARRLGGHRVDLRSS
jgi:uncharacterized protein YukE